MCQVASLLHDDVLDDADTRRGVGSLNSIMGNKVNFCFPQVGQIYFMLVNLYFVICMFSLFIISLYVGDQKCHVVVLESLCCVCVCARIGCLVPKALLCDLYTIIITTHYTSPEFPLEKMCNYKTPYFSLVSRQ